MTTTASSTRCSKGARRPWAEDASASPAAGHRDPGTARAAAIHPRADKRGAVRSAAIDPDRRRLARLLIALPALAGGLAVAPRPARADGIENRLARIELNDDGWVLQSEHDIELTPVLVEAVQRGLALWFVTELEVTRKRWYWFDQTAISAQISARLSHNAMTRQYRLSVGAGAPGSHGALALRFDSLDEALRALGRLRDWRLGDAGLLRHGERYSAALRLRLDPSQLPKPFQLNALTGRDWNIASDWTRFDFTA